MFTGIIPTIGSVSKIDKKNGLTHLTIDIEPYFLVNVQLGASIAVNGVCLTVVRFDDSSVSFDVIAETLKRTNLESINLGTLVNIERSARFGDEIGGHLLSGHISTTVLIETIEQTENNHIITFKTSETWIKYLFSKGYVALNGVSLTLVDIDRENKTFSVHLIPETLKRTSFGDLKINSSVNLELDSQTQVIVDTLSRINPTL